MSEKVEHTELRKLAEAATPGPWKVEDFGHRVAALIVSKNAGRVASLGGGRTGGNANIHEFDRLVSERVANAAFIAAANPKTVLALLAERDRLRKALGNLWDAAKEVHELGASSGGQWAALSLALEQSSPLLKDTNQ